MNIFFHLYSFILLDQKESETEKIAIDLILALRSNNEPRNGLNGFRML